MASMKRYYNPATGQLEYMPGYNDKSKLTVTEKLMADGLKKKPLTNAELGVNQNRINIKISLKELVWNLRKTGGLIDIFAV